MSWVVDSPELVAVHLLSFICHPWSSCSMDNHNNQSPGLQLLIINYDRPSIQVQNLIILHYNGTVRLSIRHIWQNFFFLVKNLEWFLSLFISISWCPTNHYTTALQQTYFILNIFLPCTKYFFSRFLEKKKLSEKYFYTNILPKSYENPLILADRTADGRSTIDRNDLYLKNNRFYL